MRRALEAGLIAGCALALAACAAQLPQGEALMASGRWDEAVAFFVEAVQRDRSDPEARAGLLRSLIEASIHYQREGEARERAGQPDEAKALYERALAYNAENVPARTALERLTSRAKATEAVGRGRALLEKGAHQEALREAELALQLVPDLPEAKDLLAQAKEALAKAGTLPSDDGLGLFPVRPITLRFRDTDIKEVLEVFTRVSGVNIFTDDAVGPKRISANFRDLPIREAFRLILTANRYFSRQLAPNTVVVVPDNPGKRQQYEELFVRTFYLTNADARVAVNLLRTILNTRQVFVNEKLNALVVRDTKEKLELAGKLLEANDRGGAEVDIELEVLEVDRTRLQDLGLQFTQQLTATLNMPGTQPITALKNIAYWAGTTISFSVTNPALTLNLLKNQGNTKILAHPTVRVLDRQKARLLIGERRPFQISQLSSVPATAGVAGQQPVAPTGAVTTTETRVEYRDLGLKLTLTPTIHLNGDVTVEINFEISAVQASTASTATPIVNTRNVDSFVKVRDGETRLLGGLFQDTEVETIQKVPFLGDLPFVGRVFSNVRTDKDRKDVLVAITPRLVKTVERPAPDIERFFSGTAEAFGGIPSPAAVPPPVTTPPPPPRPGAPPGLPGGAPPPGPPGAPFPGPPAPSSEAPPGVPPPPAPATEAAPIQPAAPVAAGLTGGSSNRRREATALPDPQAGEAAARAPAKRETPPPAVAADAGPPPEAVSLQLAAFQDPSRASAYAASLRRQGIEAFSVPAEVQGSGRWIRIFVGSFVTEAAAEAARSRLPADRAASARPRSLPYALESDPFPSRQKAMEVVAQAREMGYTPSIVTAPGPSKPPQFRVRVAAFANLLEAWTAARELATTEASFRAVSRSSLAATASADPPRPSPIGGNPAMLPPLVPPPPAAPGTGEKASATSPAGAAPGGPALPEVAAAPGGPRPAPARDGRLP